MPPAPYIFSKTVNGFLLTSALVACSIMAVFLKQHYASITFIHRSILTYLNNFLVKLTLISLIIMVRITKSARVSRERVSLSIKAYLSILARLAYWTIESISHNVCLCVYMCVTLRL